MHGPHASEIKEKAISQQQPLYQAFSSFIYNLYLLTKPASSHLFCNPQLKQNTAKLVEQNNYLYRVQIVCFSFIIKFFFPTTGYGAEQTKMHKSVLELAVGVCQAFVFTQQYRAIIRYYENIGLTATVVGVFFNLFIWFKSST